MHVRLTALVLSGLFLAACAQVPKESVELSATIGRGLAVQISKRSLRWLRCFRLGRVGTRSRYCI